MSLPQEDLPGPRSWATSPGRAHDDSLLLDAESLGDVDDTHLVISGGRH